MKPLSNRHVALSSNKIVINIDDPDVGAINAVANIGTGTDPSIALSTRYTYGLASPSNTTRVLKAIDSNSFFCVVFWLNNTV